MTKARVNADNASADIQGVTAGTGLTGGGTSGTVTLNVDTTTIQTRVANVSDTEIGYLDGVTSAIQTQLDNKQAIVSGVSDTEISYLDGVTSAIQTQLNSKATNPMTTTGDIIYSSSGSTPARLGIGSSGQFLSVNGGAPTWTAAPSSVDNWVLLNAGGTALTGAQTITVSGISGRNKILVAVQGGSSTLGNSTIVVRVNGYSTNIYYRYGWNLYGGATYDINNINTVQSVSSWIEMSRTSSTAVSSIGGACLIQGGATTGRKVFQSVGGASPNGSTTFEDWNIAGFIDLAETISSVSVFSSQGNFDAGTLFVYATN